MDPSAYNKPWNVKHSAARFGEISCNEDNQDVEDPETSFDADASHGLHPRF